MTAKDLLDLLSGVDPDTEIVICTEDHRGGHTYSVKDDWSGVDKSAKTLYLEVGKEI